MPPPDETPLHDFPDRAIRKLLENPENLRDLLVEVVPNLVDRLDFARVEILPRTFLMDDWRRREADVLFRLPWLSEAAGGGERSLLVCVLVEHQSQPDPRMPLRTLLYAVLYWEQEWKAWEVLHEHGEPLRLSAILPIVFHTGAGKWQTHRVLADLIEGPEELRRFAPEWGPLLWELTDRTPEELLEAPGEWLNALAVVRAERQEAETFRRVFAEVLRRLEGLSERERVRWHDLLHFVLSWALRRRPGREREELWEAAERSQADLLRGEEIRRMSETIERTWEEEVLTLGQARECRRNLRRLLEGRFGALPEALSEQIEAVEDLERLHSAFDQALHLTSLSDLKL